MSSNKSHSIDFQEDHPCKIIAEIGCNHKGNMDIAKEMINTAKYYCKVDAVKFQKRKPSESLDRETYNAPHPTPYNSYGKTYGAHREFLEFNIDQHQELKQYCEKLDLEYSCSVWDPTSAREIGSLKPGWIKIPSACNEDAELLEAVIKSFDGEIHVSCGMTSLKAEEKIVAFFEERGRSKDLVLYACTSGYPVPDKDVCLLEIHRLKNTFKDRVKDIGFSGHHLGIAIDIATYLLGANLIERHFTLDRTWKGTDHAASLEPEGMRKLVRDIKEISKALHLKPTQILPIEEETIKKLKHKKSL